MLAFSFSTAVARLAAGNVTAWLGLSSKPSTRLGCASALSNAFEREGPFGQPPTVTKTQDDIMVLHFAVSSS